MSKTVNRGHSIVLGGNEIGDWVERWSLGAEIGGLYKAQLDIIDSPHVIEIQKTPVRLERNRQSLRVATEDNILISGVDISPWVEAYDHIVHVGKIDIVRLYIHCDSEILSINGTTPWEKK